MKKENKTKRFIKIESSYDYLTETMQTMEEEGYEVVSFAPSVKKPSRVCCSWKTY
jgi:hypothetical protein